MIVREEAPRVTVVAVVLPNRAPGPLRQVGTPLIPGIRGEKVIFRLRAESGQSSMFSRDRRSADSYPELRTCSLQEDVAGARTRATPRGLTDVNTLTASGSSALIEPNTHGHSLDYRTGWVVTGGPISPRLHPAVRLDRHGSEKQQCGSPGKGDAAGRNVVLDYMNERQLITPAHGLRCRIRWWRTRSGRRGRANVRTSKGRRRRWIFVLYPIRWSTRSTRGRGSRGSAASNTGRSISPACRNTNGIGSPTWASMPSG